MAIAPFLPAPQSSPARSITTLLLLNSKTHVIGTSPWCPFTKRTSDTIAIMQYPQQSSTRKSPLISAQHQTHKIDIYPPGALRTAYPSTNPSLSSTFKHGRHEAKKLADFESPSDRTGEITMSSIRGAGVGDSRLCGWVHG